MESSPENPGINWSQLADLLGDPNDPEQQAMLGEMWRDVRNELPVEWSKLDALTDPERIRAELHRVRGYVATWGLEKIAQAFRQMEYGADPRGEWQTSSRPLAVIRDACLACVEARYPVLKGQS